MNTRTARKLPQAAFTRLELVATMAVLTVVLGLAFASVARWRAQEHS